MKKKITTLLLAIAFILPCAIFFTACGKEDAKVESFTVMLTNEDYTLVDDTITINYGGKVELDADDFIVTAKLSDGKTKVLEEKTSLKEGFVFESTIPTDAITPIDNYSITFSHENVEEKITINVNVVKGVVDMSDVEWDYNSAFTYNGEEKEVKVANFPAGVSVTYTGNKATNFGTYTATAMFTYADTVNFEPISNMSLTWEIEKANIQLPNIELKTLTYNGGEQSAELTEATVEALAELNVSATISGTTEATNADTYEANVSFVYNGSDAANYNLIAPVDKTWEIVPAAFEVVGTATLKDEFKNLVYNGNNRTIGLDLNFDTDNVRAEIDSSTITKKNAGTYYARVNLEYCGSSTNYNRLDKSFVSVEWEIGKAILLVTANPHEITYGDDSANAGVEYSGFVNNETKDVLGGALDFDYTYEKGNDAGEYAITPKGLTSANYTINFVGGVLNVVKKDLTLTINDVTIPYNTEVADIVGHGVSSDDFVNGDTMADLGEYSFAFVNYQKGKPVGEYDITITGTKDTVSTLDETNYNITINKGKLIVTKIDVPVSTSGIALKKNEFTYSSENIASQLEAINLPEGVTCTSVVVKDKTAIDVDDYIAVINLQYFDTTNYNAMPSIEREFRINKATVDSFDSVKLSANSLGYSGVEQVVEVQGIPAGAKIKEGTLSGNRATDVGSYNVDVTFVCADTKNYVDFEEITKTLTWNITPATLIVTAKNKTIKYNEFVPELTIDDVSISGYKGADDSSVLEGSIEFTVTYSKGDNVGSYKITPKGLTAKNYIISPIDGTLEVEQAEIDFKDVNWASMSLIYSGEEIRPVLNYQEDNNVGLNYTYSSVSPINVGDYTASVEIVLKNANYKIINSEHIVDLSYTIVPQEVDCSTLAWTETIEYVYNSTQAAKPELKGIPTGVSETYTYTTKAGDPIDNPINVGEYIAYVSVVAINANYVISEEPVLLPLNYSIIPAEIEISDLAWDVESNEFVYNGESFEPKLNKENVEGVLTFEYRYSSNSSMSGGSSAETINVGDYIAIANFIYDSNNYVIVNNGEEFNGNSMVFTYSIIPAPVELGSVDWNIETGLIYGDETYESREAEIEYNDTAISLSIGQIDEKLQVTYTVNYTDVTSISIEEIGHYDITAFISLKDEYYDNYTFNGYSKYLSLTVTTNPFAEIYIDGFEIDYEAFKEMEEFEQGCVISFELKENFSALIDEMEATEKFVTVGDNNSLVILYKEVRLFEKFLTNIYYFDEIVVGTNSVENVSWDYVDFKLAQGQTSFDISFDENYLTKYENLINYEIYYYDMETSTGVIQSVPFTIQNADRVNYIHISLMEESESIEVLSINVHEFSAIKSIKANVVSVKYNMVETQDVTYSGMLWLNNSIVTDFVVELEEDYKTAVVKCYYENTTTEVDFTDLDKLANFYVLAFDGEEEIAKILIWVDFEITTRYFTIDSDVDNINLTQPSFDVTYEYENPNVEVVSTFDGSTSVTLTQNVTTAIYEYKVIYNQTTYTFAKEMSVVYSQDIGEFVSTESDMVDVAIDGNDFQICDNTISADNYNASNIDEMDFSKITLSIKDNYEVASSELVSIGGSAYLKIGIKEVEQGVGAQSLSAQVDDNIQYIYILINIQGKYDNDTSGEIRIVDYKEDDIYIESTQTEFDVDISTQALYVDLNNSYAYVAIKQGSAVIFEGVSGHISPYRFEENGVFTLLIIATDGTSKRYTINVVGEIVPALEVVIGDFRLTQDVGTYGPTEGVFEWEPLDQYGSQMKFTTYLGDNVEGLIKDGKVKVTSVRSSMLSDIVLYGYDDVAFESSENFDVLVQYDAQDCPYIMFYANAKVDGNSATSYIYIYLCSEPTEMKVLEVVYNETPYVVIMDNEEGRISGDFNVKVETSASYQIYQFTGYLGEHEEAETITLDSIYCLYEGVMTDLISEQTFTNLTNVELTVGSVEEGGVPCVGYSVVFNPAPSMTIMVYVTLYLSEKPAYPAVVTFADRSYNLTLNINSLMGGDFGDMEFNEGYFYITESEAAQSLTELTITLNQVYADDYSYMVLIEDGYDLYLDNVEMKGVKTSEYIDSMLAATENKKAFRVTNAENLTMTIPVKFEKGLAYFDIAFEGFKGYMENSDEDMTFVRVYIVIDGVGELPEADSGEVSVALPGEFGVQIGSEMLSTEDEGCIVTQYREIYLYSSQTQASLVTSGVVHEFGITFTSITAPEGWYFFTTTGTDSENVYVQLANGGYLSSYICNTNEYGEVAQILIYNTVDVNCEVTPNFTLNIIFADSTPSSSSPSMARPDVNVQIVSNGQTFSTTNGTLVWDETNYCFYGVYEGLTRPINWYTTVDSCVITNMDQSPFNGVLKGVLDNENVGYPVELSFDSPKSIYVYSFGNSQIINGAAVFVDVFSEDGTDKLYSVALVFNDGNSSGEEGGDGSQDEEPFVVLSLTYEGTQYYLYSDESGNIEADVGLGAYILTIEESRTAGETFVINDFTIVGNFTEVTDQATEISYTLQDGFVKEIELTTFESDRGICAVLNAVGAFSLYIFFVA